MTSRWMLQVQQRQKRHRSQQGNLSWTDVERKLYKRKIILDKKGNIAKVESLEAYIERLEKTTALERSFPKDSWRVLARVLVVIDAPLDAHEWGIINRASRPQRNYQDDEWHPFATARNINKTIAQIELEILTYRENKKIIIAKKKLEQLREQAEKERNMTEVERYNEWIKSPSELTRKIERQEFAKTEGVRKFRVFRYSK